MSQENLTISSTVKKYPKLAYLDFKNAILGKKYQLSLAFVGSKRARSINIASRQKSYVPNVLSFPLSEDQGEIFICPDVAKSESVKFELSEDGYISYLFIHGLLHLQGHDHGETMDNLEKKFLKKFKIV